MIFRATGREMLRIQTYGFRKQNTPRCIETIFIFVVSHELIIEQSKTFTTLSTSHQQTGYIPTFRSCDISVSISYTRQIPIRLYVEIEYGIHK